MTELAQQRPALNPFATLLRVNATLIALLAMMAILAVLDSAFFTPRNLSNLSRQVTTIGIISVGMTMVILLEGIDLSVGSLVGLSAIVVTVLMQAGLNIWLAIGLTLAGCGFGVGAWNGWWIARYRIPPFIITLGMMTVARGLALALSNGSSVPVTDPTFPELGGAYIPKVASGVLLTVILVAYAGSAGKRIWGNSRQGSSRVTADTLMVGIAVLVGIAAAAHVFVGYRGIPVPVAIFAVVAFLGAFVLRNTRFGRGVYAVGGNEAAARLSGVGVFRTKLIVYGIVGLLSAVSGILLASRLNGASPNLGNMFELDAIASVVIGGTSLSGGSGTVAGSVVGAFIIGVLNNGMSLMGVPTFYQLVVKGFIIMLAVWFDVVNKKR